MPTNVSPPPGILGILKRVLEFFISCIARITPPIDSFKRFYPKVLIIWYGFRVLFLLFGVIIAVWSLFFTEPVPANIMYHLYSLLKLIIVLILLAVAFLILFSLFEKPRNSSTPDSSTPVELSILISTLEFVPYMYDLAILIIILAVLKAYYIRSCVNGNVKKNPNVYPIIDIIYWLPFMLILVGIIVKIISRLFARNHPRIKASVAKLTNPIIAISLTLIILWLVITYLEDMITNNLAYWMKLYDGVNSGDDCVTDDAESKETGGGDFEQVKNIIISVILGLFILVLAIVQLIPFPTLTKVNEGIRLTLVQVTDKASELLKT
tara:strand:+ start:1738 stop:2706 length:969 start_codon:yes stop_codon:yes gene_type:complete